MLSMDNPHSSMYNLLVDIIASKDKVSTDKSTTRNQNSSIRSMNLGGAS